MSQSIVSGTIFSPSVTVSSRFECNICGKAFKNKGGLTRHLNTVTKYNDLRSDLDVLPQNTVQQFKDILVHYIHKRLPRGYKRLGKQTVSVPATESQFFAVFKNYIHYYSTTKKMQSWGVKYYDQQQCTYVVLCDDDNNIENEKNPIAQAASTFEITKKSRKLKYERGQLVVKWKKQKNIDFNGNFTQADHIYFHFYNSQAMIQ
ncbi:hypothetical protein GLOIN_2v1767020 [Rhizophagus irregularis DAOM 181602=DAOM 197198]|uniref:C2H2-type domain-containing protein n=2 Tax=Rhizophagus irregularis TaxID=588596 RepID=A0A015IFS4_RHIIW|nr:hypothetical protein GLOIN_2v1767020 [Rhizophagus irregularis DAOM 181602=DAOM 197198]EXX56012.1 hypothetical protein RirG_220050 [Rhizophagus irregularis DAOM 197198w]POG78260.1 hypothetical protein GLOIN_2v1767020 [Rhizophagus irregularis DAOM 181602=DAOM 197198]GBC23654.1 hypothetical protein GLOIN_2v1767020 [Rhizophagus irregularis DAOM 181602=DAOM 197198]CAG8733604.1 12910_t:CDS:2 [Rhizophagus irregularis]|eukprot:XP_025185126.1 hypothetical protein GLOIN_2v1767020 [Rhizophagus irregularis DAOM 181602=DAOM 197198]